MGVSTRFVQIEFQSTIHFFQSVFLGILKNQTIKLVLSCQIIDKETRFHCRAIGVVVLLLKMHILHVFFDHYEATETSLKLRNKQELGKSLFKGKSPCLFLKDTLYQQQRETNWPNYKKRGSDRSTNTRQVPSTYCSDEALHSTETGVVLPALAPSAPYSTSLDCQRRTSQCFNNLFAYTDHRQKDGDSDEHFCQLLENCTPSPPKSPPLPTTQ